MMPSHPSHYSLYTPSFSDSNQIALEKLKLDVAFKEKELEAQREQNEREAQERERERERQHEREQYEREQQRERERESHELELRKLELASLHAASDSHPTLDAQQPSVVSSTFRTDLAAKLLPPYNPNDLESYLITFERIAGINSWPEDKLAAILQTQLTGQSLRVFAELSIDDSKDYTKIKDALLTQLQLVPEEYQSRFRKLVKQQDQSYADFAFNLGNLFKRWLEGVKAYDDLNQLREVLLIEQFSLNLAPELRRWLFDQHPTTLMQAARSCDQRTALCCTANARTNDVAVNYSQFQAKRPYVNNTYNKYRYNNNSNYSNRSFQNNRFQPQYRQQSSSAAGRTAPLR